MSGRGREKTLRPIEPADWREQTAAAIKREYHKGLVQPALDILRQPELERAVQYLVVENGHHEEKPRKQFKRFDRDVPGKAIDLAGLIVHCHMLGKPQRDPVYDLEKILVEYLKSEDSVKRDQLFRETWGIARVLAEPRGKGEKKGQAKAALKKELICTLQERFCEMFSHDGPYNHIIALLVSLAFKEKYSEAAVREALGRKDDPVKKHAEVMYDHWVAKRRFKLVRGTGSIDGRKLK
jgi:hypothetical protein